MPIITPAFPAFNSTFNVSLTTKAIILKEMRKSLDIMHRIRDGKCSWARLFKALPFFKAYRYYLKIDILTNDYDEKRFVGFIESKLKKLIQCFEDYYKYAGYTYSGLDYPIISLHPWMDSKKLTDPKYRK